MNIVTGDIWELFSHASGEKAICIPTNGSVSMKTGELIMGAGLALEAKTRFGHTIARAFGSHVHQNGNTPTMIQMGYKQHIISFPTKPGDTIVASPEKDILPGYKDKVKTGQLVPGWMFRSNLELIVRSAQLLVPITDQLGLEIVFLPKVGCGLGNLNWADVLQAISFLDQRFTVVTWR